LRITLILIVLLSSHTWATESTCFGTTSSGRLENAVKLPAKGQNFIGYSGIARAAGRTFVHSAVKEIIVQGYKRLESDQPDKVFKYAETGFKEGGQFKPHKTHQNGLSTDFMTPVVNSQNKSVHLPTHILNRFGYDIEFDSQGRYKEFSIDYEAMASHIVALHKSAVKSGYGLWRVIFDPDLQANLLETQNGDYLKQHIQFSKKRSWVRHDEHYHVDFLVPCEPILDGH